MPRKPKHKRSRFAQLIAKAGITQASAADLIAAQTKRPCSPRTVRTWLAAREAVTAKNAPKWAIDALRSALKK